MNAKLTALDKNAKLKAFRAPKALEIGRIHTLSRAVANSAFNRNATQYYASGAGLRAVQGVRSCSYPECMLLKCELPAAKGYIEGFVANAPNKTKLRQGIRQSFALVAAMVKAHPCLKIDFQVYLRNDGAMLNIDLDRCDEFNPRTLEPLNALQKLELAQIPGVCRVKGSGQVVLDKVLGQLYERLRHECKRDARMAESGIPRSKTRGLMAPRAKLPKYGPAIF